MHTFYKLEEKYAFFHPLSIIFYPQHDIWAYFCPPPRGRGGGVKQKNIHPWKFDLGIYINTYVHTFNGFKNSLMYVYKNVIIKISPNLLSGI